MFDDACRVLFAELEVVSGSIEELESELAKLRSSTKNAIDTARAAEAKVVQEIDQLSCVIEDIRAAIVVLGDGDGS